MGGYLGCRKVPGARRAAVAAVVGSWVVWPRGTDAPADRSPDGVAPGAATTLVVSEEPLVGEPQVLASLPEEEVSALAEDGILVAPAPSSAGAITLAEALQVALEEFGLPKRMDAWEAAKPGTTLALSLFTDLDMGTERPDGTVDPRYEDELVWVITVPDVTFPVHPPKDRADLFPRAYVADMAIFVEASTGRFIMATSVTPDDPSGGLG